MCLSTAKVDVDERGFPFVFLFEALTLDLGFFFFWLLVLGLGHPCLLLIRAPRVIRAPLVVQAPRVISGTSWSVVMANKIGVLPDPDPALRRAETSLQSNAGPKGGQAPTTCLLGRNWLTI